MGVLVGTIVEPAGALTGDEEITADRDTIPVGTTLQDIANLAPAALNAEFIVAAASSDLGAERVATDTSTIVWDFATPAQAKASLTDAVADALVVFTVSAAAAVGDLRVLTIQAHDIQGNTLAVATQFWLWLVSAADASYAVSDEGAGSITFDNLTTKQTLCLTDAAGQSLVGITDTAVETVKIAIGGGPGTPFVQGPAVLSLAFA